MRFRTNASQSAVGMKRCTNTDSVHYRIDNRFRTIGFQGCRNRLRHDVRRRPRTEALAQLAATFRIIEPQIGSE